MQSGPNSLRVETKLDNKQSVKTIQWKGIYDPAAPYKYVTLTEAKRNPEYWSVVEHSFEKQAARRLVSSYQFLKEDKNHPKVKNVYDIDTLKNYITKIVKAEKGVKFEKKVTEQVQENVVYEESKPGVRIKKINRTVTTSTKTRPISVDFTKESYQYFEALFQLHRVVAAQLVEKDGEKTVTEHTFVQEGPRQEQTEQGYINPTTKTSESKTTTTTKKTSTSMSVGNAKNVMTVQPLEIDNENFPITEAVSHGDASLVGQVAMYIYVGAWEVLNLAHNDLGRAALRLMKVTTEKINVQQRKQLLASLHFIKEPVSPADIKFQAEMAQKIKFGDCEKLDFDNPEFVRHLYRLLRLRQINKKELLKALLLHGIRAEHHENGKYPAIRKFTFEDKQGPYGFAKIAEINYILPEQQIEFQNSLTKLPPSEQYYFSVNLSTKETLYIIYYLVYKGLQVGRYQKLVNQYFNRHFAQDLKKSNDEKITKEIAELKDILNQPFDSGHEQDTGRTSESQQLINYIRKKESPEVMAFVDKKFNSNSPEYNQGGSVGLFKNILVVLDQLPTIELSPDFKADDPNTPLLAEMLLTPAAYFCLNEILHGKDAMNPRLVVGKFNLRLVKNLEEKNERPVEITHPDVQAHQKPHGFSTYPYRLTWHDMFHVWRCSAFQHKPFTSYVTELLAKVKGHELCKGIEMMVDKDTNIGRSCRIIEAFKYKKSNQLGKPVRNRLGARKYATDLHSLWKEFIAKAGKTIKQTSAVHQMNIRHAALFLRQTQINIAIIYC